MKTFKSFYEEMTFKVEVEGLPAMFMSGNSPGQVKAHLRTLIKQPSMIKSVDRMTKHDVKKTYRNRAMGKEVAEGTLDELSLDERTPVKATVQDRKLKNLRIANPNYKGLLKRKEKEKRDMYREVKSADVKPEKYVDKSGKTKIRMVPVTKEGTMGNKPEWGTPESTRKAKKMTPGETCESNCGCDKCKRKMDEKLTIGKIRRAAYKTGKVLGDVQAVKKGKVAKRVKNRVVGKLLGKAVGKLGLFK